MVHFASQNTQPGAAETVADILTAAADLIEKPGAWTRGAFARDENQHPLIVGTNNAAVCWCLVGAIDVASKDAPALWQPAFKAVADFLEVSPQEWNDSPKRQASEVVGLLRRAAEKATTASSVGMRAQPE